MQVVFPKVHSASSIGSGSAFDFVFGILIPTAFILQVSWMRYLRSWRRICINCQHFAAKMRQQVDLSSLLPGLKVGCGSKRMGPQRASKGTCESSLEAGLMEMKVNRLA